MKNLLLLLCALSATTAAAQELRERHPRRELQSQPMPINLGRPFTERQPHLKTWVTGWALTGSRPDAYEVTCDTIFTDCAVPILRTKATASPPLGTGSLTHSESAVEWRGARLQVRAELRSGRVDGWAGLWMRVDGADGQVLAFDNMQDRALRGTSSFQWYSVVLDVPADAERVTFGVLLHGPGAVYVRELLFDEVERTVASTDLLGALRTRASADPKAPSVATP